MRLSRKRLLDRAACSFSSSVLDALQLVPRSPGRPLPHPRTGKLADFLVTHQGRRVSARTLRAELSRAGIEVAYDGLQVTL